MTESPAPATSRPTGRFAIVATGLVLFVIAALAAILAENALANQAGPWLGPVQLRLVFNSGVAFSFGNSLPAWTITAITGVITLAVGVYAWRTAPTTPAMGRLGLAAIIAGALANLVDRATDGVVTDYLHTGWFPTFNLPDVYITVGALLLIAATLRSSPSHVSDRRPT